MLEPLRSWCGRPIDACDTCNDGCCCCGGGCCSGTEWDASVLAILAAGKLLRMRLLLLLLVVLLRLSFSLLLLSISRLILILRPPATETGWVAGIDELVPFNGFSLSILPLGIFNLRPGFESDSSIAAVGGIACAVGWGSDIFKRGASTVSWRSLCFSFSLCFSLSLSLCLCLCFFSLSRSLSLFLCFSFFFFFFFSPLLLSTVSSTTSTTSLLISTQAVSSVLSVVTVSSKPRSNRLLLLEVVGAGWEGGTDATGGWMWGCGVNGSDWMDEEVGPEGLSWAGWWNLGEGPSKSKTLCCCCLAGAWWVADVWFVASVCNVVVLAVWLLLFSIDSIAVVGDSELGSRS